MSLAQQRMWFLNRLDPESAVNNIPLAIRLSGDVDTEALALAVRDVLARHESLRTVFPDVDGVGSQQILSPDTVDFDLGIEQADEGTLVGVSRSGRSRDLTSPPKSRSVQELSRCPPASTYSSWCCTTSRPTGSRWARSRAT